MTKTDSRSRRLVSTHVFNFRLFLEGLKRLRILGITFAVLAVTASVLIPVTVWMSRAAILAERPPEEFPAAAACIPAGLLMLAAPLLAANLFSFLFVRKESDFFHAIPYTRTCVYVSFVAAVLAVFAAILTACGVASAVLWTLCPYVTVDIGAMLACLFACLLGGIMLTGFMLLALTVTGTQGSAALLYLLFALLVRVVCLIFLLMLVDIRLVDEQLLWESSFLSPLWFLPISVMYSMATGDAPIMYTPANILYSLAATVLLYALSCVLYARRHSEMAGNPAPGRKTQACFRILITLPSALLFTLMVWLGVGTDVLIVIAVALLLTYFLYELITTKRVRNLLKALPGLGIVAAAMLLACGMFFCLRYHLLHEPISREDIVSVTVNDRLDGEISYGDILLLGQTFEDPDVCAAVADCLEQARQYDRRPEVYTYVPARMSVIIHRRNGRPMRRNILTDSELYRAVYAAAAKQGTLDTRSLVLPPYESLYSVELDGDSPSGRNRDVMYPPASTEAKFLYRTLTAELEAMTDDERLALLTAANEADNGSGEDLSFHLRLSGGAYNPSNEYLRHFRNDYTVTSALMPKTHAAVLTLWWQNPDNHQYPLRADLYTGEAILADIARHFSDETRPPEWGYDIRRACDAAITVYSTDGTCLHAWNGELTAPALVAVAKRLGNTLAITAGTDFMTYAPTPDTYILLLDVLPQNELYESEITLWMVCDLTAEDIEALRTSLS